MNLFENIDEEGVKKFRDEHLNSFLLYALEDIASTNPSESEINETVEVLKEAFEKDLNIKEMSRHKPIFSCHGVDTDLSGALAKINKGQNEKLLLILIRDFYSTPSVVSKVLSEGTPTRVAHCNFALKAGKFIEDNRDDKPTIAILAHNHPSSIVARPSDQDLVVMYKYLMTIAAAGITLMDYIVVTPYDMFSVRQNDQINKTDLLTLNTDYEETKRMCQKIEKEYGKKALYWAYQAFDRYKGL